MPLEASKEIHETLYKDLVIAFDAIQEARRAVFDAEQYMDSIWKDHLDKFPLDETLPSKGTNHPIKADEVIVKKGDLIYKIDFDVDDFSTPVIKRIDWFTEVHDLDS